ncbi:MAG: Exonuclease small subunit [Candidatus Saccharibacteria bacterium]|nr:Exonuclease small subunit [Candidatus Saccharibacteria bacterium]
MATKKKSSYNDLQAELAAVLAWFEGDNFAIDEAVQKYERGMEILKLLEAQLQSAENKVKELKATFTGGK